MKGYNYKDLNGNPIFIKVICIPCYELFNIVALEYVIVAEARLARAC